MSVTLSTAGFYNRSAKAMGALTERAEALQTQIATTKKLQAPSDDAVAYQRLAGLKRAAADQSAFAANVKTAQSVLAQADTTLGSIGDQLTRARELAVQAGNGTLSAEAKAAIATQLRGIAQSVASLANTTDARGLPLFGGGTTGTAAVTVNADGSLAFAAGKPSAIPIGDGLSVEPSVAAEDVLKLKGGRDIGQVLAAMADTLDAGGTPAASDAADLAALAAQNTAAQASIGARAVRVELQAGYFTQAATDREATRSDLEDTDVTAAITELQQTITILSATQASFSKLSSLSLFSYLR